MIAVDDELLGRAPFSLPKDAKAALFGDRMGRLTRHHADRCEAYGRIVSLLGFDPDALHETVDYPFLPALLFKTHDLRSIAVDEVKTVLTSSGTSGQRPSRIALDAASASLQSRVLSRIVGDFVGAQRLPLLVIDAPGTVRRGGAFSARAAGILGFSLFGRDQTFALDDDMSLAHDRVECFAERHAGKPILLFGFTFMIFQHFIKTLEASGRRLRLDGATLIHGGGWKKLADLAIGNGEFKARLQAAAGVGRVHNYYGVVEQTGSIFMECEHGHLHCSNFSDIVVRDSQFAPVPHGRRGIVQLISLLARSYPGHSLLTEDEGTILGEDDCPCGRSGKYFEIHGRLPQAEIRGCSDTYAA